MIKFRKIFTLTSVIIILLGLITLLVSCTTKTTVDNDTKIENKKIETLNLKQQNIYYKLLLRFGFNSNPEPSELFARDDFLNIQKEINLRLNRNYDYIELTFQPLYYIGNYEGDESFAISKDTINQEINMEEESFSATDLKAMQVQNKLSESFSSKISEGRTFSPEDFIITKENQIINVILGNNYITKYDIGDTLNLELHRKNMEFKVIGFLEKDTLFTIDNDDLILDDYIVIPFYNIEYPPNDEQDEIYQQLWYSQKNKGFIRFSDTETINKFKGDIDSINKKYNLFYEINDITTKFYLN